MNGTTRRRALGDVTNAAKGAEVVQEGKKAIATKAGLQSKVAQSAAGGVQKLSRTNSSRAALGVKDNNVKPKASSAEVKKPGSGSGVLGTSKRRTQTSTSTIPSSKDATPDVEERPRKKSITQEVVEEAHAQAHVEVEVVDDVHDIVADLDAEDLEDPSMCAEYVREIFEYYYALEDATQPNPNYMNHQDDLEWKMRGILVDWLIEVHTRFRLLPETLFLAVNIVDRFLSQKVVPLDKLQLVGITAMFIASKYEEVLSPHVGNFVHVADDGFTIEEVLSAELPEENIKGGQLRHPNSYSWQILDGNQSCGPPFPGIQAEPHSCRRYVPRPYDLRAWWMGML
jgi:G2/mitotic-specific cyclin 1/2